MFVQHLVARLTSVYLDILTSTGHYPDPDETLLKVMGL